MSYPIYYKQGDVEVRKSFPSDADILAPRLRITDMDEIWASNNLTAWDALHQGIMESTMSLTIVVKGIVIGIFGIRAESALGRNATIWLLASDELDKIKIRFLRHSRGFIKMFLTFYPYLYNWVDVRNAPSMAWLNYCGAKMNPPEPYGVMRKDFRYFWFEK